MFTGIVQATGKITAVHTSSAPESNLALTIDPGSLGLNDVNLGDSIAVDGVCLTVKYLTNGLIHFDVSEETLRCTQGLNRVGKAINLEKALRLADRLGGHLVSGHIDAIGIVTECAPAGESVILDIEVPSTITRFLTHKGSIAVDGVSLTINQMTDNTFSVNLIPHTLMVTTLGQLQLGSQVNLETDMLARYVARLLNI